VPRRGYRKGISDRHQPKPCIVQTRLTAAMRADLDADAAGRGITPAKLLRNLLTAHLTEQRLALPHNTKLTDAFLREFTRSGNNLNQLARQANIGIVPVNAHELRATLATLTDLARKLAT